MNCFVNLIANIATKSITLLLFSFSDPQLVDQIYVSSRQSSSRYSDNHPLISSSGGSSDNGGTVLVNPFADVQLLPVTSSATSSPLHHPANQKPEMRLFGSLRSTSVSGSTGGGGPSKLFSNRSNSARAAKMRDIAKQIEQMRIIHNQRESIEKSSPATTTSSGTTLNTTSGHSTTSGPNSSGSTSPSNSAIQAPLAAPPVEQLQQQVQIRDLKTISMNTSSNIIPDCSRIPDHHPMLAKLQNVMNGETNGGPSGLLNRNSPKQRKV